MLRANGLVLLMSTMLAPGCAQLIGLDNLKASEEQQPDSSTAGENADSPGATTRQYVLPGQAPQDQVPPSPPQSQATETAQPPTDSVEPAAINGNDNEDDSAEPAMTPNASPSEAPPSELTEPLPDGDTPELPPSNPASSGPVDPRSVSAGTVSLNENFSDGNEFQSPGGFFRSWSTDSDRTGQLTPVEYAPITPENGAVAVNGAGFTEWGASLELRFDGGDVVDLRAYRGVEFSVRGRGTLTFELILTGTSGPEGGGTCVSENCWGHYSFEFELTETGQVHTIDFDSLTQPDYADPAPLDLSGVLLIALTADFTGRGPVEFDFVLDRFNLLPAVP